MLADLAAAGVLALAAADLPAEGLSAWRWERRPILVFAEAGDRRLDRQLALFAEQAADFIERRNAVVVETRETSPLVERFGPEGFTVILVGLDGGEKFRAGDVTPPDRLEALIDTMPMRRREMDGG